MIGYLLLKASKVNVPASVNLLLLAQCVGSTLTDKSALTANNTQQGRLVRLLCGRLFSDPLLISHYFIAFLDKFY